MRCPLCNKEIASGVYVCDVCGFDIQGIVYFVNEESFNQWKTDYFENNKELLPLGAEEERLETTYIEEKIYANVQGSYVLEKSHLYYRYDPQNYNTERPLWSYENPKVLRCTSKQLEHNCRWITVVNNKKCELLLSSENVSFGDLLFATIDNERFYFIVFDKKETSSAMESQSDAVVLEKSHLYYHYDPKNYNTESPLWTYENPQALNCMPNQLYQDCCWELNIRGQKCKVILLGGSASFGDLLFARINGERFYFIIFKSTAKSTVNPKNAKYCLEKSKLYYHYDPKNFNAKSPIFSSENPMTLGYNPEQIKNGSQWTVQVNNETVTVYLTAGEVSRGDLFFAIINNQRYYFILL